MQRYPSTNKGEGMLIAFEGCDGTGKTTQVGWLIKELIRQSPAHVPMTFREPGGSPLGQRVRELLIESPSGMNHRSEALLFLASRAALWPTVCDLLQEGHDVILDRFVDSTLAYQGYGRGLELDKLGGVCDFVTGGAVPHLTIVLDGDKAMERARRNRGDDVAGMDGNAALQREVRRGYLSLAGVGSDGGKISGSWVSGRYAVINADLQEHEVAGRIWQVVQNRRRELWGGEG